MFNKIIPLPYPYLMLYQKTERLKCLLKHALSLTIHYTSQTLSLIKIKWLLKTVAEFVLMLLSLVVIDMPSHCRACTEVCTGHS